MAGEEKVLLRMPSRLKEEARRLSVARTRSLNGQLVELIKVGLSLERLPDVEPSGEGDTYESAHTYRERLQRMSEAGP